ncbi:MAG: hypothetical protein GY723_18960 [bacterium]|nr:hypothetical protein [bacterium]MCP5068132.1 hypothetical protein [bacterium]
MSSTRFMVGSNPRLVSAGRAHRLSAGGLACALAGLLLQAGAARAEVDAFDLHTVRVPGRPVEAFSVGEKAGEWLVVLSVEGTPPDEVRHLSALPPGLAGESREKPRPRTGFVVPDEVFAIDVGDFDPAPGLEALSITPRGLRIQRLIDGAELRRIALRPALPLPRRTRQLSRLEAVRNWEGNGKLSALVPTWNGALLIPLDTRPPRLLPLPVLSEYETLSPGRPIYEGYATARFVWPEIVRADDNGDGVPDLFASNRFHLWVFHAGPPGLDSQPTRRARFRPFSFNDERRHETHRLRTFIGDLDSDGHAEVIEHRSVGTLLESRTVTRIHSGGLTGADPSGPAMAEFANESGFGGLEIFDLEGNGRKEIFETVVPFGILQLARVLTTRHVTADLRVLHFPEAELGSPVESWATTLRVPLDFSTQRVQGLLPDLGGDWNGDGLRDLIHGDGPDAVRIRLGQIGDAGPGFGPPVARQTLPFSDLALITDLDSDGLDDLITYDTLDLEGHVYIAINQGRLPGTRPVIRSRPTGR